MPAIDDSNVLPSVNVDRSSGIEHVGPEQQCGLFALLDEFAACFSEEPALCGVGGVWLLFAFLVCEMVSFRGCLAPLLCYFGSW